MCIFAAHYHKNTLWVTKNTKKDEKNHLSCNIIFNVMFKRTRFEFVASTT